jgi:hypothetical protein
MTPRLPSGPWSKSTLRPCVVSTSARKPSSRFSEAELASRPSAAEVWWPWRASQELERATRSIVAKEKVLFLSGGPPATQGAEPRSHRRLACTEGHST